MNSKTLRALKGSIEKWKAIAAGTGVDHATDNCPLCAVFHVRCYGDACCVGCPVREHTDKMYCMDTPFRAWFDHQYKQHEALAMDCEYLKVRCPTCKSLAAQEVKFLESLVPRRTSKKGRS